MMIIKTLKEQEKQKLIKFSTEKHVEKEDKKGVDRKGALKYNSCAIFADTRRWISYEDDVSA